MYGTLNQKKVGKIPEALANFAKLQENWSVLVENSLLKKGNKYFGAIFMDHFKFTMNMTLCFKQRKSLTKAFLILW